MRGRIDVVWQRDGEYWIFEIDNAKAGVEAKIENNLALNPERFIQYCTFPIPDDWPDRFPKVDFIYVEAKNGGHTAYRAEGAFDLLTERKEWQRMELVEKLMADLGVSRATAYRLIDQYKEAGAIEVTGYRGAVIMVK